MQKKHGGKGGPRLHHSGVSQATGSHYQSLHVSSSPAPQCRLELLWQSCRCLHDSKHLQQLQPPNFRKRGTPPKTNMEPKDCWLVDVFPIPRRHVLFLCWCFLGGCTSWNSLNVVHIWPPRDTSVVNSSFSLPHLPSHLLPHPTPACRCSNGRWRRLSQLNLT